MEEVNVEREVSCAPSIIDSANLGYKEYIQPKSDLLKEYQINIKFLSIGCIIDIGCKSVAFTTAKEAMIALNEYVENPHESRKKWNEEFKKQDQ